MEIKCTKIDMMTSFLHKIDIIIKPNDTSAFLCIIKSGLNYFLKKSVVILIGY